jgi:hypothetical protein
MVNTITEAGLFFMMLGFAVFFSFITLKGTEFAYKAGLRLVAMALFCMCAIIVGSGNEIAYTVDSTIHNAITNETWTESDQHPIIPGGETSSWLGFLFYGFALVNLVILTKEYAVWQKVEKN